MSLYKNILTSILLAALFALWPADSVSEVYQWTDKKGTVHFTDDPEQLPEPQRSKALRELYEKQEQEKKERKSRPKTPTRLKKSPVSSYPNERLPPASKKKRPAPTKVVEPERTSQKSEKEIWQEKADRARKEVQDLSEKCKRLETLRDQSSRNSLVYARPGDRQKHQQAIQDLEICQKDLKEAQDYLNKNLPEEARRAGIPPGWLR
jgi:hypothetical protein